MLLILLLWADFVMAAPPSPAPPPIDVTCSASYAVANLNEMKSKGGASNPTLEFIEIKILQDNTDISGWTLCESDNPTKETCVAIGAGNGTWFSTTQTSGQPDNECIAGSTTNCTTFNANTWISYPVSNIKADAGEVILFEDMSSSVILDYIRYDNTAGICGNDAERWNQVNDILGDPFDDGTGDNDVTVCGFCFEGRDPDQKDFARSSPDGTGDWGNNGDTPTEGSSNDVATGSSTFQISNDTSASTCSTNAGLGLREPITITVYNTGGNISQNYNSTVNLSTSTGNGSWFTHDGLGNNPNPPTVPGNLADPTSDDGAASYLFDANDDGVVTLYLASEHAETLTVTVQDPSGSPTSTSSSITFSDNVFVVSINEPLPAVVDTVPVAGRPHQFQLEMMRRDVSQTPADCGVATGYSESAIKAWYEPDVTNHPVNAAAPVLRTTVDTTLTSTEPATLDAANFTIAFTSGMATFELITTDVGKYSLRFKDDSTNFADITILGDSSQLTVRPFAFGFTNIISGATNNPGIETPLPDCGDISAPCFTAAGEIFAARVGAYLWQSVDDDSSTGGDTANDGVPDSDADVTDNGLTPGYAWLTSLDVVLNTPAGATAGVLGGSVFPTVADFQDGGGNNVGYTDVIDLIYSEVGSMKLAASASDFLNTVGVDIYSESGVIGRFIPFDFTVTNIEPTPTFAPACTSDTTQFTYMDQPFGYSAAPQVAITAVNKQGTKTDNYDAGFWKLDDFTETYTHTGDALSGGVFLDTTLAAHDLFNCVNLHDCDGFFQTNFSGSFTYQRGSTAIAPFNAKVDISFSLTDTDGVSYSGNPFTISNIAFTGGNNEQRWGRLVVGEEAGDGAVVLNVPLTTEYYDGADYVSNADDDCTGPISLMNHVSLSNLFSVDQTGDTAMTIGGSTTLISSADPITITDGSYMFAFDPPGSGETGFVDITVDITIPGANIPWLLSDWDDDGSYDNNPEGRATFGIISRPDEIIYFREPWN